MRRVDVSRAGNVCAHFAQQGDEIGDFRFSRGVFQNGFAFGQCRGHQNVFRAGDSDFLKDDVRASQAAAFRSAGFDVSVRGYNFCAHFFERREVQIDGPCADGATTGKRNARNAGARQSRAKGKNRSAHRLHQLVRGDRIADGVRLKSVIRGREFTGGDGDAHVRQQFTHGDDVANLGDVVQRDAVGGQQGSRHAGKAEFFAPLIVTVPWRGVPPVIRNLSIQSSSDHLPFFEFRVCTCDFFTSGLATTSPANP